MPSLKVFLTACLQLSGRRSSAPCEPSEETERACSLKRPPTAQEVADYAEGVYRAAIGRETWITRKISTYQMVTRRAASQEFSFDLDIAEIRSYQRGLRDLTGRLWLPLMYLSRKYLMSVDLEGPWERQVSLASHRESAFICTLALMGYMKCSGADLSLLSDQDYSCLFSFIIAFSDKKTIEEDERLAKWPKALYQSIEDNAEISFPFAPKRMEDCFQDSGFREFLLELGSRHHVAISIPDDPGVLRAIIKLKVMTRDDSQISSLRWGLFPVARWRLLVPDVLDGENPHLRFRVPEGASILAAGLKIPLRTPDGDLCTLSSAIDQCLPDLRERSLPEAEVQDEFMAALDVECTPDQVNLRVNHGRLAHFYSFLESRGAAVGDSPEVLLGNGWLLDLYVATARRIFLVPALFVAVVAYFVARITLEVALVSTSGGAGGNVGTFLSLLATFPVLVATVFIYRIESDWVTVSLTLTRLFLLVGTLSPVLALLLITSNRRGIFGISLEGMVSGVLALMLLSVLYFAWAIINIQWWKKLKVPEEAHWRTGLFVAAVLYAVLFLALPSMLSLDPVDYPVVYYVRYLLIRA